MGGLLNRGRSSFIPDNQKLEIEILAIVIGPAVENPDKGIIGCFPQDHCMYLGPGTDSSYRRGQNRIIGMTDIMHYLVFSGLTTIFVR